MSSLCHCQCMVLTVYALRLEEILVRVITFVSSVCHCQRMVLTVYALNIEEIHVCVISVSLSAYGPYSICSEP